MENIYEKLIIDCLRLISKERIIPEEAIKELEPYILYIEESGIKKIQKLILQGTSE